MVNGVGSSFPKGGHSANTDKAMRGMKLKLYTHVCDKASTSVLIPIIDVNVQFVKAIKGVANVVIYNVYEYLPVQAKVLLSMERHTVCLYVSCVFCVCLILQML